MVTYIDLYQINRVIVEAAVEGDMYLSELVIAIEAWIGGIARV
jgi:hypothetical protein